MTKIEIPFNEWSKEKLNLCVKEATSRTKKYGDIGDTFIVGSQKYEIDLIIKLPLWFIAQVLYKSEGALNMYEFFQVWDKIHFRKKMELDKEIWYHHFKEIEG